MRERVTPGNVFTDPGIAMGAKVLFAVIAGYDLGQGCWADRSTLADLVGTSVSSVNRWIRNLRARGYLTVYKRNHLPAVIRLVPETRSLSGLCLPPAELDLPSVAISRPPGDIDLSPVAISRPPPDPDLPPVTNLHEKQFVVVQDQETTNSYQEIPYSVPAEPGGGPVVVTERSKSNECVPNHWNVK